MDRKPKKEKIRRIIKGVSHFWGRQKYYENTFALSSNLFLYIQNITFDSPEEV